MRNPPWQRFNHLQTDRALQLALIFTFLALGILLRVIWPTDMEWKWEERWMFDQASKIVNGEMPLPLLGMKSSVLVNNPGMSVWSFAFIRLFVDTPVQMAQFIQWLNGAMLLLFTGFILWQVPKQEQTPWLWGMAIMAVNPFAVLFSRRIWTPDILSPFVFVTLVGHWFRHRFWGAFFWGLASLASGQVQMGGFFFAFGLAVWTAWTDWREKTFRWQTWVGWATGSVIAFIPLVPWLMEIVPQMESYRKSIVALLFPKFYAQWITAALGTNLSYTLKEFFWGGLLQEPKFLGLPTYGVAIAHLGLVMAGAYPAYRWWKTRKYRCQRPKSEPTRLGFYLKAMAIGTGGAYTLSRVNIHPYYIVIVFPFIYFWLATLYQHRVKVLVAIAVLQLFISVNFLTFVHRTGGMPACGDGYGVSYRFQTEFPTPIMEDCNFL
ncbi:MAG: hypothetical protein F6J87_08750 [Spirulina sp. SIO3F2]|nr:hypothetical protein [Spirulina sp. SIO3F2]